MENKQQSSDEVHSEPLQQCSVIRRFLVWWHKQKYKDSLMDGRIYGKFYVRYPDGQRSMLMYYKTAKDYAEMFGGEVKCVINGV